MAAFDSVATMAANGTGDAALEEETGVGAAPQAFGSAESPFPAGAAGAIGSPDPA